MAAPLRAGLGLANDLADLFELGAACNLAPFEDGGLGGRQNYTVCLHAPQRRIVVNVESRPNGIDRHINLVAGGEQIEACLHDANMGLDSNNQHLVDVERVHLCHEIRAAATAERKLGRDFRLNVLANRG